MDTTKRDMTCVYGGRTFALRAYRDGDDPSMRTWRAVIIEARLPLRHGLGTSPSAADCFAGAVRYLAAAVEAQPPAAEPVRVPTTAPASPTVVRATDSGRGR